MAERISHVISTICKELGIPYQSINPNYTAFVRDAIRLGEIYRDLKGMIGDLLEIEERHQVDGLGKLLQDDVEELNYHAHHIVRVAKAIQDGENV